MLEGDFSIYLGLGRRQDILSVLTLTWAIRNIFEWITANGTI